LPFKGHRYLEKRCWKFGSEASVRSDLKVGLYSFPIDSFLRQLPLFVLAKIALKLYEKLITESFSESMAG